MIYAYPNGKQKPPYLRYDPNNLTDPTPWKGKTPDGEICTVRIEAPPENVPLYAVSLTPTLVLGDPPHPHYPLRGEVQRPAPYRDPVFCPYIAINRIRSYGTVADAYVYADTEEEAVRIFNELCEEYTTRLEREALAIRAYIIPTESPDSDNQTKRGMS